MDIQPQDILKWVGIVLAGGFIGYFGRYLAMLIIKRLGKKRPPQSPPVKRSREMPTSPVSRPEENKLKLAKKRAKARVKRAKKAGKK
ncbi:hypothetical protein ACFLXT_01490 [Chloroflexota bacterium]